MKEKIKQLIENSNTKLDVDKLRINYYFDYTNDSNYIRIDNIISQTNSITDEAIQICNADILKLKLDFMLQHIEDQLKNQYNKLIEPSKYTLYGYNVCIDNNLDENTIICHPKLLNEIMSRTTPWLLPGCR